MERVYTSDISNVCACINKMWPKIFETGFKAFIVLVNWKLGIRLFAEICIKLSPVRGIEDNWDGFFDPFLFKMADKPKIGRDIQFTHRLCFILISNQIPILLNSDCNFRLGKTYNQEDFIDFGSSRNWSGWLFWKGLSNSKSIVGTMNEDDDRNGRKINFFDSEICILRIIELLIETDMFLNAHYHSDQPRRFWALSINFMQVGTV